MNSLASPTDQLADRHQPHPLRVCMVVYAFYESDTRVMQYATALAERGDVVDVIALKRNASLPDFEVFNGVNLYRVQSRAVNEKGILTYASRLLRFLIRSMLLVGRNHLSRRYDLVHTHNAPDFLAFAALVPRCMGSRVILDIHDLLPELFASKFGKDDRSLMFKLLRILEKGSAAFAHHVIVANHLWLDRFVARSSKPSKCSVVRNHPVLNIFRAAPRERSTNGRFILSYPGSLNWHQGVDIAIRAFARIAARMPDAEFHIYGEGPEKPSLERLATTLGMSNRIIFHNFLPSREVAQAMAATDLAIEPKRSKSPFGNEALSTKLLEFMALRVPIVASRTTIHARYYDDSIIKYYGDDDEEELAACILEMRANVDLRRVQVERAAAYAADHTWQARQGDYLKLVDSLVSLPPTTQSAVDHARSLPASSNTTAPIPRG